MPDPYKPSEFGGKPLKNGIQPPVAPSGLPGHTPTASEKLRLLRTTAQENDQTVIPSQKDQDAIWSGLETEKVAEANMPEVEMYRDTVES